MPKNDSNNNHGNGNHATNLGNNKQKNKSYKHNKLINKIKKTLPQTGQEKQGILISAIGIIAIIGGIGVYKHLRTKK